MKSKILKLSWNILFERNGLVTIIDSDGILWSNEKLIEEGIDYNSLRVATVKCPSGYRKHRYELVDEPKNQITKTKQKNQKNPKFLYTRY